MSQQSLGELREEVFLEHLEATLLPGQPYSGRQRSNRVLDKAIPALPCEPLLQGVNERVVVVPGDVADELVDSAKSAPRPSCAWAFVLAMALSSLSERANRAPWAVALVKDEFPCFVMDK
jgi:hypothetical protein